MQMATAELVFGLCAALRTFLVVVALANKGTSSDTDLVEERLRTYEGAIPQSLADLELRVSFTERVLLPALRRLAAAVGRSMPARVRHELANKLTLAGRPLGLSAADFTAVRYAAAVVLALGLLGLGTAINNPLLAVILAAVGGVVGLYGPVMWLRVKISKRQREIQTALPDALDLMIVAVEAGLSFEAAIARVAEEVDNALGNEFARVLQETRLGRPRLEALEDLGRRCGVEDLHNFVQAIIQSEQLGSGVTKILNLQGEEIRRRRLQRAQELGAQASLKMLIPMVGCIFPTLWLILLGPAGLILLDTLVKR